MQGQRRVVRGCIDVPAAHWEFTLPEVVYADDRVQNDGKDRHRRDLYASTGTAAPTDGEVVLRGDTATGPNKAPDSR